MNKFKICYCGDIALNVSFEWVERHGQGCFGSNGVHSGYLQFWVSRSKRSRFSEMSNTP